MRFLLVDLITQCDETAISGVKNVAMSEDFLEFHFQGNPVMPGVLLVEAMSQLAGWHEAVQSDFRQWFLLDTVVRCSYYGFALPGDQVALTVTSQDGTDTGRRKYVGEGTVNGARRVVAELEGAVYSLAELEDPEAMRRMYQRLIRSQRGFV